jgi:hypothetical protein
MRKLKHYALHRQNIFMVVMTCIICVSFVIFPSVRSVTHKAPPDALQVQSQWENMRNNELWPAQSITDDINGGINAAQVLQYTKLFRATEESRPMVFCETGFFRGASTLLWLLLHPNTVVHTFDINNNKPALAWFDAKFPNRVIMHIGNTKNTIPDFLKLEVKCDWISIDGDHAGTVPYQDIKNIASAARPNAVIVSDDTFDCNVATDVCRECLHCKCGVHGAGFCNDCSSSYWRAHTEGFLEQKGCHTFGMTVDNTYPAGFCHGTMNNPPVQPTLRPRTNQEKDAFVQKIVDEILSRKHPFQLTMVSPARMQNVVFAAKNVIAAGIEGDFVETGTWKGGCSMVMRAVNIAFGDTEKRGNWLFDTFAGLPAFSADDARVEKLVHQKMDPEHSYAFEGGLDTVKQEFVRVVNDDFHNLHFVQGFFNETVAHAPIKDIAVLRLDGDMYSSTMDVLHAMYHKVSRGGYVIIDDYGHWPQCKLAIHDFFDGQLKMNIASLLQKVDGTGYYFVKP